MLSLVYFNSFFFFKQKTAYEIGVRLVGSEMCIRDRSLRDRVYAWENKGKDAAAGIQLLKDELKGNRLKLSPELSNDITELLSRTSVSYTHLRAHETDSYLVCRLLLEKKKKARQTNKKTKTT